MDNLDMELNDSELGKISGGSLEDHEDSWKRLFRQMKNKGYSMQDTMNAFERHIRHDEDNRALYTQWIKEVFAE